MFKRKLAVLISFALLTLSSGTAFATFADLELIRVYYDRTTGTEIFTDLGKVKDLTKLGTSTTISGSYGSLAAASSYAVYYAINAATNEIWVSGKTSTPSVINGTVGGLTTMKSGTSSMYGTLNTQGGTTYNGTAANSNSYKAKLSAVQGYMSNAINNATRFNTEAKIDGLINTGTGSVIQTLYYWSNGLTTVAAEKIGVAVATITTNADGSTTITPLAAKTNQTIGTITFTPATLAVGDTTTVSASATSGLMATFSSTTTPSICSVSGSTLTDGVSSATVTGLASGTCTITSSQAGNGSYNVAPQVSQNITVTAPPGPVVSITTPPPPTSTSATVSINFSATVSQSTVNGYMITDTPSAPLANDAGWQATAPTSYTFPSIPAGVNTSKTVYAWARDETNNVSPLPGTAQVTITIPALTVTIVNNPSDISNSPAVALKVTSVPVGIDCASDVCIAAFDPGLSLTPVDVTLSAFADSNSIFTGWSNSNNILCNGSTGTCSLTMISSQGITATFDRIKLIRTTDGTTPKAYYGLVQNAFNSAVNGDVIQAQSTLIPFSENLILNQTSASDVVSLNGGWDSAYNTEALAGVTTIQGTLQIKSGKLIVRGVAIRSNP